MVCVLKNGIQYVGVMGLLTAIHVMQPFLEELRPMLQENVVINNTDKKI